MRKTAVFVDHANLSVCARNRGLEVDYYHLKDYLAQEREGRMPLETFCYVAIDPRNEHRLDREIRRMQEDGWLIKTKRGAPRPEGGFKCNVDVEMAIDMVAFAFDAKPDIVVMVTGDQDFAAVVRKLRERGIRVEVAAFPENVSHVLLNEASGFINLERYFKDIECENGDEDVDEDEEDMRTGNFSGHSAEGGGGFVSSLDLEERPDAVKTSCCYKSGLGRASQKDGEDDEGSDFEAKCVSNLPESMDYF